MSVAGLRPLVGLTCCRSELKQSPYHIVGEKYITAVLDGAEALPLLIPALGTDLPIDDLLDRLDGLLLTGSPSNVEPHHYDGPPQPENNPTDPARDATTLPLIRRAIARGLPVLGICRGMQELNVALYGTLHQEVHKVAGRHDHRSNPADSLPAQYGPAHSIALSEGGWLQDLTGCGEVLVNSLHGQGIDRVAPGLAVEATAPDGQVEAVRLGGAEFVIGVQWHPEYRFAESPVSQKIFAAFGAACRSYAARRAGLGRAA
jgi:putative glutamine amidotransferase